MDRQRRDEPTTSALIAFGVVVLVAISFYMKPLHNVPEGHVGVYWRFGALLPPVSEPGLHFHIPLVTSIAFVQVTMQTDVVTNIPCGTSGGVTIFFDKIEVVNLLERSHVFNTVKAYGPQYDKIWIFDKIHHEINQFCSKHTLLEVYIEKFETLDEALSSALQKDCDLYQTGIKVITIRVTKPRIPDAIRDNFEEVENKKAMVMVAEQEEKFLRKKEETQRMQERIRAEKEAEIAKINAEKLAAVSLISEKQKSAEEETKAQRLASVSKITQEMKLLEKWAEHNRSEIGILTEFNKRKSEIELVALQRKVELETLKAKLTPEYLRYAEIMSVSRSLARNSKFYFGEKIPSYFLRIFEDNRSSNAPAESPVPSGGST